MIQSFKDEDTRSFFHGDRVVRFQDTAANAARRLTVLDSVSSLHDLAVLRSNRLEMLQGASKDGFSVTIEPPWRICFAWTDDGPRDVEIVDYD